MNNIFDFSKVFLFMADHVKTAGQHVATYLSSLPNNKLAAIFLFLALVILFCVLILVWYVRTAIVKAQQRKRNEQERMSKIDTRLDRQVLGHSDRNDVVDNEKNDFYTNDENKRNEKQNLGIDFDWNRNTKFSDIEARISDNFQYRLKPQKLEGLLGLIVDLLSRGVDEPKIAQTLMYKNQHLDNEDDIIQTITAIKFFVYMCLNGRFKKLDTNKILPEENAAVFHIAKGDCSLALVLLETGIDNNIAKIKNMVDGDEKERKWCETSNCATIFGTLAAFENIDLALAAFELAIEINPRNVTAWGRIGDMYVKTGNTDKAVWAYSNVINLADEGLYTQQIANANKMLSSIYAEKGRKQDADVMWQKSQQFYDRIGINAPLTERETKIVYIIESTEDKSMETIVDNLFNKKEAL